MKLIKLSANQPGFKTLKFNPTGLTLILGTENSGTSSNGVGKTLALRLIHHCLGANADSSLKLLPSDWNFSLLFEVNGTEHIISRSADGKNISLNQKSIKVRKLCEWLDEANIFHNVQDIPNISFRSLFPRFARSHREDCTDPLTTHKENPVDSLLRNAFLIDLNIQPILDKQKNKKDIMSLKESLKLSQNQTILSKLTSQGINPKLQCEKLEKKITALQKNIKNFAVAEDFKEIEEKANDKKKESDELKKQVEIYKFQLGGIEKSLQKKTDISSKELNDLYAGLGEIFKPEILEHFNNVEKFHQSLTLNREKRLNADKRDIQQNLAKVSKKIKELKQEQDKLLASLKGKTAMNEYIAVIQKHAKMQEELEGIKRFLAFSETTKEEILNITETMAHADKIAHQYVNEDPIHKYNKIFKEIIEKLYPEATAGITLEENTGLNQLQYALRVAIEGDDSDGINEARILAYDWLLLMHGTNHTMDFLWHDNRIFSHPSPIPRAKWFSHVLESIQHTGKQYIASLNTENFDTMKDELSESEWEQMESSIQLRLAGDKPENKLLGRQFGQV